MRSGLAGFGWIENRSLAGLHKGGASSNVGVVQLGRKIVRHVLLYMPDCLLAIFLHCLLEQMVDVHLRSPNDHKCRDENGADDGIAVPKHKSHRDACNKRKDSYNIVIHGYTYSVSSSPVICPQKHGVHCEREDPLRGVYTFIP